MATYRTRADLESLITRYLDDPDERRRLAAHGRAIVLERHTFDLRAQALCDVAEPLAARLSAQRSGPDNEGAVTTAAAVG